MLPDIPILSPLAPQAPPADLAAAVDAVLDRLGGTSPLLIVVNDPQRHTLTRPVLEALAARIDLSGARVLVAAGTHSFALEEREGFQRRLTTGQTPLQPAGFAWHYCRAADLVPIDQTSLMGSPSELRTHNSQLFAWRGHPWLAKAGAILAIGSVEPHYFAGFTGAHKTATIGCASHADIEANHAHALDPACRPCRIDGNPIYIGVCGLLASLERERPVAALNLVQVGGRILAAYGGGAMETLRQAIPLATETFCRTIPRPADAIIAEVAGPLGVSFYQADKGIKNNEWAVRDGGCLILQAPCPAAIGQDHFMALLREAPTYDQAVETVKSRGYRLGDHKAVRLRYLTDPRHRGVRLFLVSEGLSAEQAALLGATKAASAEEALTQAGLRPGRDAVYRVRDAGNVCVVSEEGHRS